MFYLLEIVMSSLSLLSLMSKDLSDIKFLCKLIMENSTFWGCFVSTWKCFVLILAQHLGITSDFGDLI